MQSTLLHLLVISLSLSIVGCNSSNNVSTSITEGDVITSIDSNNKNSSEIILNGATSITLTQGEPYTELGASAGDATVIVSGGINTHRQGTYLITYIATDKENKVSSTTRTIIVKRAAKTDGTPDIQLTGEATIVLVKGQPYKELGATISDQQGTVTPQGTVDTNKTGIYTLVYTATNSANKNSIITRTVIVVLTSDSPKPNISLLGGNTIILKQGDDYSDLGVRAGNKVSVEVNSKVINKDKVGVYEVIYTATDEVYQHSTIKRTVKVVDQTPPVVLLNGKATIVIAQGGIYEELSASVTDNNDVTLTVDIDSSRVDTSKVGQYEVTYTATDSANNTSEIKRTIKIEDKTPPVITFKTPYNATISQGAVYIKPELIVTDNNDPKKVKITEEGNVDPNKIQSYKLIYTATDSAGNSSQKTITINVIDKTAPVITLKGEKSITLAQGKTYTELGATVTDNHDSIVDIKIENKTVDTAKVGSYEVVYTATDKAENSHQLIRTINITDQTPPVITLKGEKTMTLHQGDDYEEQGVTVEDNNDTEEKINVTTEGSVDSNKLHVYEIKYTATDQAGNTATVSRIVTIKEKITGIIINSTKLQGCLEENLGHTPSQLELQQLTSLQCQDKGLIDSDVVEIAQLTALTSLKLGSRDYHNRNKIADLTFLNPLTQLTFLDLSYNQISDLAPLSALTQLTSLDLRSNKTSDLAPLSVLTQLTSLYLGNNQLSDLAPLSALTQLTTLDLGGNQISDLAPLRALTQLTTLDLGGNQISDLAPLRALTQLTALYLGGNQISDLTPLSALTQLTSLYLDNNRLSDLAPLSALTQLTSLDLENNQLSDLAPLSALTQLTALNLYYNPLSDLAPLSALTQLNSLYLYFNRAYDFFENQTIDLAPLSALTQLITLYIDFNRSYDFFENQTIDLAPLSALTQLTSLYLDNNQTIDLAPLSALTQLTSLYLHNNQISDLAPLSALTQLTSLNLNDNQISDLAPLSALTQLTSLGLYNNQISGLAPLSALTQLTSLNLNDNQISDLAPLSALTQLTYLNLSNNQISSFAPLSALTQLTSLDLRLNQISDLARLSALTQLTSLGLDFNQIIDLAPLSALTQLTSLDLDHNQIIGLAPLSALTQLTSLGLDSNQIIGLAPLSELTQLQSLDLSSNCITDFTSVAHVIFISGKDDQRATCDVSTD